jgi:hypothetical protein
MLAMGRDMPREAALNKWIIPALRLIASRDCFSLLTVMADH